MKVRSTVGSADWESPVCKCKTWIKHWCNNTSETHFPAKCPGCKNKVENVSDWDGAHVRKVNSNDKDFYITPLCSSCNPKPALEFDVDPVDMDFAFEKYRDGNKIKYIDLMHEYTDIESYSSYDNAFKSVEMEYLDPYEILKMAESLDLVRIRNGDSKYLIRELFRMKYPEISVPEKIPMPRPVDEYFKNWEGPTRPEFRKDIEIKKYSGNQKWLMWCLEEFLNKYSAEKTVPPPRIYLIAQIHRNQRHRQCLPSMYARWR